MAATVVQRMFSICLKFTEQRKCRQISIHGELRNTVLIMLIQWGYECNRLDVVMNRTSRVPKSIIRYGF